MSGSHETSDGPVIGATGTRRSNQLLGPGPAGVASKHGHPMSRTVMRLGLSQVPCPG